MTGFKPRTSGFGSDRSANRATTTVNFLSTFSLKIRCFYGYVKHINLRQASLHPFPDTWSHGPCSSTWWRFQSRFASCGCWHRPTNPWGSSRPTTSWRRSHEDTEISGIVYNILQTIYLIDCKKSSVQMKICLRKWNMGLQYVGRWQNTFLFTSKYQLNEFNRTGCKPDTGKIANQPIRHSTLLVIK